MAANTTPQENEESGKPYDQFFLFGDSITQMSSSQELGFGFQPALQDGKACFLENVVTYLGTYACPSL